MLSTRKMLYQTKLILDCLPEEEYNLISPKVLNYINENLEYDENIKIDPNIPLENQDIDGKTYEFLEKIIKDAEENEAESSEENSDVISENIRLKKLVEILHKENSKIPRAKDLIEDYQESLKAKDEEIENLKRNNETLIKMINKLPKLIRKIWFKEKDIKLLNEKN